MATRNASGPPPTADRLRREIDSGQTRDKTPASDPAAAPLGTDDEAAGTPPSAEERNRSRPRDRSAGSPSENARQFHISPHPRLQLLAGLIVAMCLLAIALVLGR